MWNGIWKMNIESDTSIYRKHETAISFVCLSITRIAGIYVTAHILKINENATLVFSMSFPHGLVNQNFVFIKQLNFTYSIKRLLFALLDCQYALFKIACSKTNYPTPCNVAHEWFVFLHRAISADWVDNIIPTSKCRYVVSISKYSKIKS